MPNEVNIMTRKDYNRLFNGLQTSINLGVEIDEEVGKSLLDKASRARCGEEVELTLNESILLHRIRSILYLTLGYQIEWKSEFS